MPRRWRRTRRRRTTARGATRSRSSWPSRGARAARERLPGRRSMVSFEHLTPTRIVFGAGRVAMLPKLASRRRTSARRIWYETLMSNHIADRPRAVLVGVQLPEVSDPEHATHLAELRRLVHTLGYDTVATLSQRRAQTGAGTVLGTGKLKELAHLTGGPGVIASGAATRTSKAKERWAAEAAEDDDSPDEEAAGAEPQVVVGEKPTVVVVDHELTPSQLRNLEKATGALVLDRTGVIVDIFHR